MEEIWKDIEGYEGLYQVSNVGRVKSLERMDSNNNKKVKERILKPSNNGNGYLIVNLWKEGKGKTYKVHRLVAVAFLPNPKNLPQVNHRDENKLNNNVNNLEFCNHKYNSNYGTRNNRISESNTNGKCSKSVLGIHKVTGLIVEYPSLMEAYRKTGIDYRKISLCCLGKKKSAGGYYWEYLV